MSNSNNITIDCVSSFLEKISTDDGVGEKFYRGHRCKSWLLLPSLYRDDNRKVLENEDIIINDIISKRPSFFKDDNTMLDKLVRLQHHQFPTRLMDITDNPLVALYFACQKPDDKNKENGVVICFKIAQEDIKYTSSDRVAIYANLSKVSSEFKIEKSYYKKSNNSRDLKAELKNDKRFESDELKKEERLIKKLVHFIREERSYFKNRIVLSDLDDKVLIVKPNRYIERMNNQCGAFIMFGIERAKMDCSKFPIEYEQCRYEVLHDKKKKILEELNYLNINEATIMGDLDSIVKHNVSEIKKKK